MTTTRLHFLIKKYQRNTVCDTITDFVDPSFKKRKKKEKITFLNHSSFPPSIPVFKKRERKRIKDSLSKRRGRGRNRNEKGYFY